LPLATGCGSSIVFEQELANEKLDWSRARPSFYNASLSRHLIASLNQFARDMGLLDCDQPYEEVVAEQFQHPDLEK
jgi:hypothetical protein